MKLKPIHLIPVVILIIGFVLMMLLSSFKEDTPKEKPKPQIKFVESVVVKLGEVESRIEAYGRLKTSQPVALISEVQGKLIKGDVDFQPAQTFKKGDLLLKIDDRQQALELNSMKSDFLNALASVLPEIKIDFPEEFDKWQSYFNKIYFDKELPPLPDPVNHKIKLYLTRFNVYKLFFTIKNMEIVHSKHFIYAPFNGSILTADLRIGSTARPGSRLGEIINLGDLEVEVPIAAADIEWIDYSQPVRLTSKELNGKWDGRIIRTGSNIEERTQTVSIFIKVNDLQSANLYNGMFLTAEIPGKIVHSAVSIPRKSLYNEQFVYLITNGKLDYRLVQIPRKEKFDVIVTGGIDEGDTLITELMQGVAPGMPAEPIFEDSPEDTL